MSVIRELADRKEKSTYKKQSGRKKDFKMHRFKIDSVKIRTQIMNPIQVHKLLVLVRSRINNNQNPLLHTGFDNIHGFRHQPGLKHIRHTGKIPLLCFASCTESKITSRVSECCHEQHMSDVSQSPYL